MGVPGRVSWCWEFQHDMFLSSTILLLSPVQCLDIQAGWKLKLLHFFCFQINIFFQENILWAVGTGFTGSANLFQEVVKFKACMFLLSLLLPSVCFQLFLAVRFMNMLLPATRQKKQCCQTYFSCCLSEINWILPTVFQKTFSGISWKKTSCSFHTAKQKFH